MEISQGQGQKIQKTKKKRSRMCLSKLGKEQSYTIGRETRICNTKKGSCMFFFQSVKIKVKTLDFCSGPITI